ncbi:acyltransferase [Pseudoalteromonas sp. SG45-1]|uniref:acyltransferase family protein n=1 Tax=Pseudoalteromonas sp. SG45-1 TaxID=2760957 RepID=UPI0016001F4C|nr:acyltransferase [Pseudoalteromonas sp. SG45-1]MBB1402145.1 acyltransferase [Pseudoalteromonas sp. SG45-1]
MKHIRQLSLDGLRGIAALSVVIYHYFYRIDEIYNTGSNEMDWTYFGHFGVHLFFMISGFVIFMSISKETKPVSFIVSRFSRLYPTYFFAVIITFTVVYIFGLQGREVGVFNALLNLLMFQEFLGISHVDGVYWTLTVEITFYFWCFVLILFKKIDLLIFTLFSFLFLSFTVELLPENIYKIIGKLFFINYVSFFLLGVMTYKLKKEYLKYRNVFQILLIFTVLFINNENEDFIAYGFIYIFFLLGVYDVLKFLKFKVFIFMGEISYSLYLVHQNIGYVIITKMMNANIPKLAAALVAFIVSVLLAKLMYTYIEVKLSRYVKLYLNNKLKEARI